MGDTVDRIRRFLLLVTIAGAFHDPLVAQAATRTWLAGPEEISRIGVGKVEFGLPLLLVAASDGGFALADRADNVVRAFDRDGTERWSSGGRGSGPGEFAAFTDLLSDSKGGFRVLDPGLGRVTTLNSDGSLAETRRVSFRARRLLPGRRPTEIVVTPNDASHLWIAIGPNGASISSLSLPEQIRFDAAIIGEPFTARSALGGVIAYRWSSRLVFLDRNLAVRGVTMGVDDLGFPELWEGLPGVSRVDPEAPVATLDVSAADDHVFHLVPDRSDPEARVIDVYSEARMEYVGSVRIEAPVVDIAALGGCRIATLERDFIPVVRMWNMAY